MPRQETPRPTQLPADADAVLKLAAQSMFDTLASTADGIRLAARNAVYDDALSPNSLVYPR